MGSEGRGVGGAGRGVTRSSFPGSNIHSSSEQDSGGVSAQSVRNTLLVLSERVPGGPGSRLKK